MCLPSFSSFEAQEAPELRWTVFSHSELLTPKYSVMLSPTAAATRTLSSSFDSPNYSASNELLSAQSCAVLPLSCTTTLPALPRLSLGSISPRAQRVLLLKICQIHFQRPLIYTHLLSSWARGCGEFQGHWKCAHNLGWFLPHPAFAF
jgi:hypothetical protein